MLAMGVPLLVLCRWLWLGGIDNWLHADLWHSLRQTLLLGAGGALLTTPARSPSPGSACAIRARCSACWRV
jgi:iron(III) transport system permease protein